MTRPRRTPSTAIPITSPEAVSVRPPSWLYRSRTPSSIRASISPPRRLRQRPPTSDTVPSAAVGTPCSAATTTDSEPSSGTTDESATGAMFLSSNRSSAMSVVYSPQAAVRGVIACRDTGRRRRSVGKFDGDFALVGQCLVGRHDQAGLPDETRGPQAARMHRDDRGLCSGDEFGKGGGERGKDGCALVGHGRHSWSV